MFNFSLFRFFITLSKNKAESFQLLENVYLVIQLFISAIPYPSSFNYSLLVFSLRSFL